MIALLWLMRIVGMGLTLLLQGSIMYSAAVAYSVDDWRWCGINTVLSVIMFFLVFLPTGRELLPRVFR